jgi:hypothetical protein
VAISTRLRFNGPLLRQHLQVGARTVRLAGILSVMRAMSAFGGVVTMTKVRNDSGPLFHSSKMTAMAIG